MRLTYEYNICEWCGISEAEYGVHLILCDDGTYICDECNDKLK